MSPSDAMSSDSRSMGARSMGALSSASLTRRCRGLSSVCEPTSAGCEGAVTPSIHPQHRQGEQTMTIIEDRTARRRSLPDEATLAEFRARARVADETNTYFHEDLDVLRSIGYLAATVPEELGGWGMDLASFAQMQRRLAKYAPATALAMSMHHYWLGLAAELEKFGDTSCRWILERAVEGTVFAAGHAEVGNDAPVVMSTTLAERVDGGYRFTGRKMFGSNGPVWSLLGVHGIDASDPTAPVIVHGFVDRASDGVTVVPNWDTLGMRASQSYDTVLDSEI